MKTSHANTERDQRKLRLATAISGIRNDPRFDIVVDELVLQPFLQLCLTWMDVPNTQALLGMQGEAQRLKTIIEEIETAGGTQLKVAEALARAAQKRRNGTAPARGLHSIPTPAAQQQ